MMSESKAREYRLFIGPINRSRTFGPVRANARLPISFAPFHPRAGYIRPVRRIYAVSVGAVTPAAHVLLDGSRLATRYVTKNHVFVLTRGPLARSDTLTVRVCFI